MDRSSKQKINKEIQVLNDTLDEMDLIDIFRKFHPKAQEYTFFSSAHGTFSRIEHILGHKSNLSKFKKIEIISSISSDHNTMRLLVYLFIYFSQRLITLHYCSGFCHTLIWISHGFTCVPHPEPLSHLPPHPIPLGHPNAPALRTLSHASNLDWWSVSHMIIYMFQCYSLKLSHLCLLPQSPKDCSIHLCLVCCLTYRVIVTIFLNSNYMC